METTETNSQQDVLDKIHAAASRLNDVAEDTTREIEALEKQLVDIEPGVTVWSAVLMDCDTTLEEDDRSRLAHRTLTLGFAKTKKKWGIAIREQIKGQKTPDGPDSILEDSVSLLRKADRELRILAAPHLEQLTHDILGELEARLARLPKHASAEADDSEGNVNDGTSGDAAKAAE